MPTAWIDQFRQYIATIEPGGALIYNENDAVLKELVEQSDAPVKHFPYSLPEHFVDGGTTFLETAEGAMPLQVFGKHNLSNLEAARWICLEMGVQEEEFHDAIASFSGAQNRMQRIAGTAVPVFRDFAHAPSKVHAAVNALAEQYGRVRAVLELHTFSSLNPEFLPLYQGVLDQADERIVYYSPKAVAHKKLPPLTKGDVSAAFGKGVTVLTTTEELQSALNTPGQNKAMVLMSSGNFSGLELKSLLESY